MTELYLVRHGQTEWSRTGRHTSITDLDLTETGVAQAEALRTRLNPADFQLVLSSPRLRARRTAELAGFGDHLEVEEDLAEWYYGDFEGLTSDQIRQQHPGWRIWFNGCRGGESADQVRARLTRVVARVRASGAERAICFAHGHSLRVLALSWLDFPLIFGQSFPLEVASVSVLGREKESPAVIRWNS
ncbi:probable phosphoglycerate mutase [Raineyella antarctica]|uniref:Probable phosphoglycerate mutase n=1 Tax=Raineyella antarctica TaxID=1577474 RepID=A0A1G6GDF9_9ACTN|nr:histidine phosphatase family protein [Raineyella antarctica]SDB80010.1 probable phosphoglycerate mutase [Raineyella antarctica]